MLHLSQTQLADALGVTFQQVQKYEKGVNRISASRLQQISQILQVSIPFFFEGFAHRDKRIKESVGRAFPHLHLPFSHYLRWVVAQQGVHADQRDGSSPCYRSPGREDGRQRLHAARTQ
jgi:transcriptional regulator with XRE-family HTH domain